MYQVWVKSTPSSTWALYKTCRVLYDAHEVCWYELAYAGVVDYAIWDTRLGKFDKHLGYSAD